MKNCHAGTDAAQLISSFIIHNLKDMDLQKIRADFPILSREVYGEAVGLF